MFDLYNSEYDCENSQSTSTDRPHFSNCHEGSTILQDNSLSIEDGTQ